MRKFKNILILIAIITCVGMIMYLLGLDMYIRPMLTGFIVGMIARNIERKIIQKKEGKSSED